MSGSIESVVEEAVLEWLEARIYASMGGLSIAPREPGKERQTYADVILDARLRDSLVRLNTTVSHEVEAAA